MNKMAILQFLFDTFGEKKVSGTKGVQLPSINFESHNGIITVNFQFVDPPLKFTQSSFPYKAYIPEGHKLQPLP